MPVPLLRHLFTVEEFHRLADAGVFVEDDRVELIEGEIIHMTPIGSRHAACVARLTALLSSSHGDAILWVQNPLHLGERSELQPDVALLRPRADYYAQAHPEPEDVFLVIEVADASAVNDREVKLPLYVRAGIAEVWLVDLSAERVEVYRKPAPHGYQERRTVERGHQLAPQTLPALELSVDAVLG
jgi:Uma2 family endonuclease